MWIDLVVVALVLWFPLAFAVSAWRRVVGTAGTGGAAGTVGTGGPRPRAWSLRDRADVVIGAAECAGVLAVGRAIGAWDAVPAAVWTAALALALFALLLSALVWRRLPWVRDGARARLRWANVAGEVAFAAFLVAIVT